MSIKPLFDKVLVKPLEEKEEKVGNIYIPESAKEKPQQGVIIAVGPGRTTAEGKTIPMSVKKGDKVFYGKYSGTEVTLEGEKMLIMSESDIYGIIE
ncbi:MAG: co-chaperone GroES [Spirochaetota bacterium]